MGRARSSRAPHIRDVAARAGVGVGTVSRVINGGEGVTAARIARVIVAIDELGYRPSSVARNLSLGRTAAVGVIAPFFTNLATMARLRGITSVAAEEDYSVLIVDVETVRQRERAFGELARRDRVDGVVVISLPVADADVEAMRREGLEVVLVDTEHPDLTGVISDDVGGGELATRHLLERGHTRIGFVGDAPDSELGFTSSERRHEGYRRALAAAGLDADPALALRGTFGRESARALAGRLLSSAAPPTAIFAASDIQAMGVLEAAGTAGLRVPDELAVIGYDDIELAAVAGLSTVRQPLSESGAEGMRRLLDVLRGGDAARVEVVQPLTLVPRRSTGEVGS